jgi:iron(III) transport system ATP-binding protein
VIIGGRLVADAAAGLHVPPEARRVGLMFQDYALFPHLTVFDNVAFGVTDRSPATRARLEEALVRMGLDGYARSYPHVLSGGQQQRCALLRALAPEPDILLLDEPFSNLDVTLRTDVRDQAVALLKDRRVTTLVVTHDPQEAMAIAERLWILYQGRVVQSGSPEEIYARPRHASIARLFGPVNAVFGMVRGGAVATPLGVFSAPGLGEGVSAQVLIRPEGLRVAPAEGAGATAQVMAVQLLGRLTRLRLAVAGIAEPLEALVPGVAHPLPGENVRVGADPGLAFVFAEEAEAA